MQVYQKKIKKMVDYSGNQKISFMIPDDQFDRYLRALGNLNRSQLMRDLLMKAVRDKEQEMTENK
jgi:metal-responsive CopG/Arc/MetJ family transcriptional regulator